jgi:acyl-coenzyme A synthetase/AMP-(fatty) acid ligase
VFIDELPRNQTGKVLKRELLEEADDESASKSKQQQKSNGKPEAEKQTSKT